MIYSHEITLPKKTNGSLIIKQTLKIVRGLIYKIEITFPAGCMGLAHVKVLHGAHQIWPDNPLLDFHLDDWTLAFDDLYLILIPPYELMIYGYNEDTGNDHTIHLRIGMVSSNVFMARFLPTVAQEEMQKMIRKEEEMQRKRKEKVLIDPFPWIRRRE